MTERRQSPDLPPYAVVPFEDGVSLEKGLMEIGEPYIFTVGGESFVAVKLDEDCVDIYQLPTHE